MHAWSQADTILVESRFVEQTGPAELSGVLAAAISYAGWEHLLNLPPAPKSQYQKDVLI